MRHSLIPVLALLSGVFFLTTASADVTIVYPVPNGNYPITDPPSGNLNSAYFTSSFSVDCEGGEHTVTWKIDNVDIGSATFYDQITVQFVHKLPAGGHALEVETGERCGYGGVKFFIGT